MKKSGKRDDFLPPPRLYFTKAFPEVKVTSLEICLLRTTILESALSNLLVMK